ncbi:MAG: AAA family ATPase [Thermofilum sp.]|uniref:nucleotide-binding protein n=1 Tax=Thermofilum sp. TaxID=1961369 RepID=UPI002584C740|nr:AAA family ATPase [Thermofilum sp.]MCI4407841.1 AAA family ATPase [Thermofilum sp.]
MADVMKAMTSQAGAIAAISSASAPNVLTCPYLERDTCCWDNTIISVPPKIFKLFLKKGLNINISMRNRMTKNIYRICVLGVKGGVGKSTIALSLSLLLAKSSKNVLFIDKDIFGYASSVSGIRGKGLLSKVIDGETDYWNSVSKHNFGEGSLTVLKLYGDGERFYNDIKLLHSNYEKRTLFSQVYKNFLTSQRYDYFVVDNYQGVSADSPLILDELEDFYSVLSDVINLRVYVTNYSLNSIYSTIDYAVKLEKSITYKGFPLAFIVNMVPSTFDDLEQARKYASVAKEKTGTKFSLIIPIYQELIRFSLTLHEFPESVTEEVRPLVNALITEDFESKEVTLLPGSIEKVVEDANVVLVVGEPCASKIDFVLRVLVKKEKNIILVSTNPKMSEKLKKLGIKFTNLTVTDKFKEDRFNFKNIREIIRASKKLSTEIVKALTDNSCLVIYRTNDITPASNCCDVIAEKQEFWSSFISNLKFKGNVPVIFICEKIGNECESLEPFVDYVVEVKESKYNIRRCEG